MHKVFISYHDANDQKFKEALLRINDQHTIFIDQSVDTGDISDELDDATIRERIRDEYLRDSTVTIVLVGLETKGRKHVDWEIYSSMYDGRINKKSGVLVVVLPEASQGNFHVSHDREKEIYPSTTNWTTVTTRAEYERLYPYLSDRLIDNLLASGAKISVTTWETVIAEPAALEFLIHATSEDRATNTYDISRPMRRANA